MNKKALVLIILIMLLALIFIGCETKINKIDNSIEFHSNYGNDIISFDPDTSFSREGYTFIGWSYEKDGEIVPVETIDNNSTVYAQWKINSYKVKFYVGINLISEQTIDYSACAVAPSDEEISKYLDGKEFVSWDKAFDNIKSNLTINAILQEATIKHTVSFVQDGETIKEYELAENKPINESIVPQTEKGGFSFVNWVDENGVVLTSDYIVTKNATFSPIFALDTPINPTITSDKDLYTYGDSISISATNNYVYDDIDYTYSWSSRFDIDSLNETNFDNNLSFISTPKYVGQITYFLTTTAKYQEETKTNTGFITVNVEKANLTVSISDTINLSFGDSLPESHTVLIEGYKLDDNYDSLDGTITYNTNYSNIAKPGKYDIEISGLMSDYYTFTYITKSFDVNKKSITISDTLSKVYDSTTLGSKYVSSLENGTSIECEYESNSANVGTYSTSNNNLIVSFNAKIDSFNANNEIIDSTSMNDCFDVTYSITATINPADIEYTTPEESYTYNYNNTAYGETVTSLTPGSIVEYSLDNENFTKDKIEKINAGKYEIFYRIHKENYNTVTGSFDLIIKKANIEFNLDNKEVVYGNAFDDYSCQILGEKFGTEFIYSYSCQYEQGSNVGSYDVSLDIDKSKYPNFNITSNIASLNVTSRVINVSINSASVVYGEKLNDTSFAVDNIYTNDNKDDIVQITSNYILGDNIHSHRKLNATSKSANYTIENVTGGDITVTKRPISLLVADKSIEYGNDFDTNICQYSIKSGSLYNEDTIAASYSCSYTLYSKAGSLFPISASATILSGEEDISENYNISITNGNLSIIPRSISISINDRDVIYGNSINLVDCTYNLTQGLIVNEDNLGITYICSYSQGDIVGSYSITANSSNENYNVSITQGILTVGKRNITITVDETKAQNGVAFTKTFSSHIVSNMFSEDTINGTITSELILNGEYASNDLFNFDNIKVFNENGNDVTNCYDISYNIHVIIDTLYIDLTATGVSCKYDALLHTGELIINETGLTNLEIKYSTDGETFSNVMPEFKDAGEYTVSYIVTADNKTPTEASFKVIISKIDITISASNQSISYGDENEPLSYSITNGSFISGEESLLEVSINCDYTQGKSIGIYPITISTNSLNNYNIKIVNASISVEKRTIDIQVSNNSMVYGDNYSQPKYVATNLYNNDTSHISISVENYSSLLSVGSYKYIAITTNSNYELKINDAYLTVEKRIASITAKDITISYGQSAVFDADITNLLENEVVTYTCNYSNVGTYTITPVFENSNYDLTITPAILTVVKANLTITINVPKTSINYGDELPTYTISKYDGFVYDEDESILNGSFSYYCEYLDVKKAGTYKIAFSGLSADNYNIIYSEVSCVVNKVLLTFNINEVSPITYLDKEPTYTYTVSGYVNGDDSSAFSGVTIVSTYKQNDNASSTGYAYYVDVSNAVSDNYMFTTNGTKYLIVNKYTPTNVTCSAINGIVYSPTATLSTYESLLPDFFTWENPNTKPVCAISTYNAIYNPNPINYNDVIVSVPMQIAKATTTISYTSLETNYTGSEIDYISIINASTNNTDNSTVDYEIFESIMKDGGIYALKLSVLETANYLECILNLSFSVKAALIGSTYYTIEDALSIGGSITVLGNSFMSAGTYDLKSGSTLSLYHDDANTLLDGYASTTRSDFADYYESTYLKKRLTLRAGTTLNVYGTLQLGGITTSPSTCLNGHTSENYTQIDIESTSSIIVKSGGLIECRGYIKGEGKTIYENGSNVYYPFAVRDFKGGTNTYAIYNHVNAAPFEQFEMPNNQTYQTINYGSTVNIYCVLYANRSFHSTTAKFIASSGAIFNLNSGTIDLHVVPQSKTVNAVTISYFKFNGDISLGSLSMKVNITAFTPVTVDTKNVLCPISYLWNITIESGIFTIANPMQIMTGSSFTVNPGAEVVVNANLMIRSTAFTGFSGPFWYPTTYGPAQLINNGTITINSVSIGGCISSTQSGAQIIANSFTHGISTKMCTGKKGLILPSVDVEATQTEANLLLVNSDETTITPAQNTTYTYNGSMWS